MAAAACLLLPVGAGTAFAKPSSPSPSGGGATFEPPPPPPEKATLVDGRVIAPASAPARVKRVIAAANRIAHKPYKYGGGHGQWNDAGYDCSGSVSFALHGAGLLGRSLTSGGFQSWGAAGAGRWITIYANPGHVYMVVNGRRFDTTGRDESGSRWQWRKRSSASYTVRHPPGL